jgi:hypothetical protein
MPAPISISGQKYEKTGSIVANPGWGACLGISGAKVGEKPKFWLMVLRYPTLIRCG